MYLRAAKVRCMWACIANLASQHTRFPDSLHSFEGAGCMGWFSPSLAIPCKRMACPSCFCSRLSVMVARKVLPASCKCDATSVSTQLSTQLSVSSCAGLIPYHLVSSLLATSQGIHIESLCSLVIVKHNNIK